MKHLTAILLLLTSCGGGDGVLYQAEIDANAMVDLLIDSGTVSVIHEYEVKNMLEAKYQEVILRERGK